MVIGERLFMHGKKHLLPEELYLTVAVYLCPDWLEDAWYEEHLCQASIMLVPRGMRGDFSAFVALMRDCERGHSLAVCKGVDPRRYECRMCLLDYFLTFLVPRYLGKVDSDLVS